jgi:hypothetical protein
MELVMPYWRSAALVMLAMPTAACVTLIHDLSVGPVSVRTAPAVGQLPQRQVISVILRTRTDLSRLPTDELIHASTFFCDRPDDFALLGRAIYTDPPLTPVSSSRAKRDPSRIHSYVLLLEAKGGAAANSVPPRMGFDLSTSPRAVCVKLEGGYIGMHASSNTVEVSAESIREAFAVGQVESGG